MNDPLDPAIVEKAAQALHDLRSLRSVAFHEVGQPLGDTVYADERRADARVALEAAADDIRAEALREAAEVIPSVYLRGSTPAHWLRARADALEVCCPHPKCPGGSLCCCADTLEAGQS